MTKKRKANRQGIVRYVRGRGFTPVSEVRRYFAIESEEEAVLEDEQGKIFFGLPEEIARTILALARDNKIGLEYSAEFAVRVLIGIYPIKKAKEAAEVEVVGPVLDYEDTLDDLKSA